MEETSCVFECLAGFAVNVECMQQRAHDGHEHTCGGAVAAAVADEHRGLTVGAAEEVVVVAGDDERRSVSEVQSVAGHCGWNLWQDPALQVAQLHPRVAVFAAAIGEWRLESPGTGSGRWIVAGGSHCRRLGCVLGEREGVTPE